MNVHEPMPLARAAKALHLSCRVETFRRRLRQYERRTGRRILVRGGTVDRPAYFVTIGALRRNFPEWFEPKDHERVRIERITDIARAVAEAVRESREETDEIRGTVARLAAAVGDLTRRMIALENKARRESPTRK